MFRFWGSESRGSEKTVETSHSMQSLAKPPGSLLPDTTATHLPTSPVRIQKRRRQSIDEAITHATTTGCAPALKRAKQEPTCAVASLTPVATPTADGDDISTTAPAHSRKTMENAREIIQFQFGHEILLKHDELRLINQELAKCQVALEQLRRCHLIPFPINCPTPQQMLEISSGKGPALRGKIGLQQVPRWAPPFGVIDGPYARHYAKWLIPDPMFDGMQPEWQPVLETGRSRLSQEGRTTRNSLVDLGSLGKRPSRGISGQKLHALSSGYPQPKEKAGPCVLKRADGQTVKLVCLDCQRENFSSTQGFINHCRIAHRRDFKSHEEAAVHSGHIIEVDEGGGIVGEEKAATNSPSSSLASASASASGLVHPFAHSDLTTQQAFVALRSRIADSLKLYHQGKLPGVNSIPTSPAVATTARPATTQAKKFVSAPDTPYLSRLLKSRNFNGNLGEIVGDAKTRMDMEEVASPSEDSEDVDHLMTGFDGAKEALGASRMPVVMRVPARTAVSPPPGASSARPTSSKGRAPSHMTFASPTSQPLAKDGEHSVMIIHDDDVDMDTDLSPNTLVSNNAPSLVSDDGEYDDSDDGSSDSGASDSLGAESVSDVAEITIEEDHEPRSLRHHRGSSGAGSGTAMRLGKDENKHVTFVSPVKSNTKDRRPRKV
jgi:ADA HAT complex component 1